MIKPSILINLLESDSKILEYTDELGHPLWFLVRYDVFLSILNLNNNLSLANQPTIRRGSIFKTLFFAIKKSPVFCKANQILFFCSGVTNVKRVSDGKFFNRVTDNFFFRISSNAALIEDTAGGELRIPRVHNKVYPHLSLVLLSRIVGVFYSLPQKSKMQINNLLAFIFTILDENEVRYDRNSIKSIVYENVFNFQYRNLLYAKFFKWKRPKVIFLEDACYGNKSFILLNAKRNNIPVVELQHGFVNEEHFAYRLGKGIIESSFAKLFYPDYYLCYGKYWQESINIPSIVKCIGNPYLVSQTVKFQKSKSDKKVLFLSSAVAFEEAIEFLIKLKEVADTKGYGVVFRPHPLEENIASIRYKALKDMGIEFSTSQNIYEDFSKAEIIIGELSTALFESLAMKNKRQFLFMSSYTESYFDPRVEVTQVRKETIDIIFSESCNESISNYFWSDNWEVRFEDFIKSL